MSGWAPVSKLIACEAPCDALCPHVLFWSAGVLTMEEVLVLNVVMEHALRFRELTAHSTMTPLADTVDNDVVLGRHALTVPLEAQQLDVPPAFVSPVQGVNLFQTVKVEASGLDLPRMEEEEEVEEEEVEEEEE